jgi:hypothetical protein
MDPDNTGTLEPGGTKTFGSYGTLDTHGSFFKCTGTMYQVQVFRTFTLQIKAEMYESAQAICFVFLGTKDPAPVNKSLFPLIPISFLIYC